VARQESIGFRKRWRLCNLALIGNAGRGERQVVVESDIRKRAPSIAGIRRVMKGGWKSWRRSDERGEGMN
jgi:hypothetical protein